MKILLAAIYPYAFLLLYLIIPFDNYIRVLPNILMGVLVVAFPFIVKKSDFQKLKNPIILLFSLLFIYLAFNSFLSERISEDGKIIVKVLLSLGLAILYIPVSDFNKINKAIIFSSLAAILFSVYNFVLITDATGSFAIGDSPQVVESLLIDRLYLGLLSVFSILISLNSFRFYFKPENNYHLANIVINVVFIILIASKIAIVALLLLLLLKVFYVKNKKVRFIGIVTAFAILIAGFFIIKPFFENNINESSKTGQNTGFLHNSLTLEIRYFVWVCVEKVIKEENFTATGMGFSETKDKLASCYENTLTDPEKRNEFISERYNTHNQFTDFYLSAGFIALLLFILFLFGSFLTVRTDYFKMSIFIILILYCMVENMFHRQIGAYYVGFILIMLSGVMIPHKNTPINSQ